MMAHESIIRASAPGTLMLMGEHAVVHGELAIACAVNRRIRVDLALLPKEELQIHSALANYRAPLESLPDHPKLRFILQVIAQLKPRLPSGLSLTIDSDFSDQVGLGSSSAVTVAVVAALLFWIEGAEPDPAEVFDEALNAMLMVQGRGSGTDIAACTYGGVIGYRRNPLQIKKLPTVGPIGLYYAGYKTPTPQVLARVREEGALIPELYSRLYALMGETTEAAVDALTAGDMTRFARLINYYQGLMDALGVNDRKLASMVYQLREMPGVGAAKISGSGLGDCVISIGLPVVKADACALDFTDIPVSIHEQGVEVSYV